MTCERVLEILDAYVDGELDVVNGREVEWHLSECAGCRERLEARRALAAAIQKKVPYYRVPAGLRGKLEAIGTESKEAGAVFWRRSAYALAACLALVVGTLTLVVANGGGGAETHTRQVAAAVLTDHLRSLQGVGDLSQGTAPGHLVDVASPDERAVRPWFSGKLAFAPSVRAPAGYEMLGARLDVVLQRQVAAVVYKRANHVINLFTWPAQEKGEGAGGFAAMSLSGGYNAVKWTDANGMEYWAVSDAAGKEVMDFAKAFDAAGT